MDQHEDGGDSRLEFHDPEHDVQQGAESGGTAKLLVMFFGAAVVCAVFFGIGYKMGRGSAVDNATLVQEPKPVAAGAPKPSAMPRPASVESMAPEATSGEHSSTTAKNAQSVTATPTPISTGHPAGNFAVQVAAVTREEDADALVSALRNKNYPVFVVGNQAGDKFFHVQVGPFATLADAEAMRARLAADGYNPILKK